MPLTSKGKKVKKSLVKQHGEKKGTSILYAMINAGKLTGAEGSSKHKKKKKKK